MMSGQSDNRPGMRKAVVSAAVAGLAMFAFSGYTWWSVRGGPLPNAWLVVTLAWLVIGVTTGAISRRYKDGLASWAGAWIGGLAAYQLNYAIDPNWPRSEDTFEFTVVVYGIFLVPYVIGGHALGAKFAKRIARRGHEPWTRPIAADLDSLVRFAHFRRAVLSAATAGLATFAAAVYGWSLLRSVGPEPDLSQVLLVLIAIGAVAGYISGRSRDALVTAAAVLLGWMLAYEANRVIEPTWIAVQSVFEAGAIAAPFLLPIAAAGHLLGAWAAGRLPGPARPEPESR
jgi:hypothetical protein